jgi:hypothetical protein
MDGFAKTGEIVRRQLLQRLLKTTDEAEAAQIVQFLGELIGEYPGWEKEFSRLQKLVQAIEHPSPPLMAS